MFEFGEQHFDTLWGRLRLWLRRHPVATSLTMAGVVFAIDVSTPLGVASAVPYSLAVLVALNSPSRRYVGGFAILCCVLTLLDMGIGSGRGGTELWKVWTNRFLSICMICITTVLGMMRKQAEEQRRQAEARTRLHLADLAHLGRAKTAGQLAASLAHELNQPLAAISLHSEVATELAARHETPASPTLLAALREITEQSQRAADIIQTLRRMVRKTEPEHAPVQINELIQVVLRLMDAQIRRAQVDLQLQLSDVPPVLGDKIQLEQVLLNLLQNAIDALDPSLPGPHVIQLTSSVEDDGQIMVAVRDTGVGFAPEDCERVFERFYTTKPHGMGMGLAISRSIIEAHSGRISATANPDRGADFRFTLPVIRRTPSWS